MAPIGGCGNELLVGGGPSALGRGAAPMPMGRQAWASGRGPRRSEDGPNGTGDPMTTLPASGTGKGVGGRPVWVASESSNRRVPIPRSQVGGEHGRARVHSLGRWCGRGIHRFPPALPARPRECSTPPPPSQRREAGQDRECFCRRSMVGTLECFVLFGLLASVFLCRGNSSRIRMWWI